MTVQIFLVYIIRICIYTSDTVNIFFSSLFFLATRFSFFVCMLPSQAEEFRQFREAKMRRHCDVLNLCQFKRRQRSRVCVTSTHEHTNTRTRTHVQCSRMNDILINSSATQTHAIHSILIFACACFCIRVCVCSTRTRTVKFKLYRSVRY